MLACTEAGEDGDCDFICGTNTEYRNGSRNPKAIPWGRGYRLEFRSGKVKLVVNETVEIEFSMKA